MQIEDIDHTQRVPPLHSVPFAFPVCSLDCNSRSRPAAFDAPRIKIAQLRASPFSRGSVRVHPNAGNCKTKWHCRSWHCICCAMRKHCRDYYYSIHSSRMDLLEVRSAVSKLSSIREKVI